MPRFERLAPHRPRPASVPPPLPAAARTSPAQRVVATVWPATGDRRRARVPSIALAIGFLVTACEGDGGASDGGGGAVGADAVAAQAAPTDVRVDNVAVGAIRTIEIDGRVLGSLPSTAPAVDADRAELGRLLFWDPILSGDSDVACATCHLPELGYTDGQPQAIGVGGVGRGRDRIVGHTGLAARNAQSVLNTAWNGIGELGAFDPANAPMFHDNRATGLAAQALDPIRSREEMRGLSIAAEAIDAEVISRLNAIAEYAVAFESSYGPGGITLDRVADALAAFQSTLVANAAPFDRWMRGESDAMTAAQIDGLSAFVDSGCADCHAGPMFSDFDTHVLGVEDGTVRDEGDGEFGFRTPTLRQLRFTAPYFHAGQRATLEDVLDFYDGPGRSENPAVPDEALAPELLDVPNLGRGRRASILRFLDALNDPVFDRGEPASVPSGLAVGGSLAR